MHSLYSPWQRRLLLVGALALLACGIWLRLPALRFQPNVRQPGDERSAQERFNEYAFERFVYNDILSLYHRDGLHKHPRPFLDYQLEYPVGIGAFIYLLAFAGEAAPYYLLSALVLSLCALAALLLLWREPGSDPALLALAPALALHVAFNWDALAILPTIGALAAARRDRWLLAGTLLALATWTKVFPAFFGPPLFVALLRDRRWGGAARLAGAFTAASLAINLPVALANFDRWAVALRYQVTREREVNLWTLFPQVGLESMNDAIMLLTLLGLALACGAVLRGAHADRLERAIAAGAALLCWNLFIGKVYSPQYGLWVLALLALLGAPRLLAIAYAVIDLIYFLYSFIIFGVAPHGAAGWFYDRQLIPAMVVREALLLLVAGWALSRAWGRAPRAELEVSYAGAA